MTVLSTLATIWGALIGVANFPQVIKIFKRRSAKDISIISVLIFFSGAIIWILYGIELQNIPILVMNGLAFISLLLVLVGWFLYGRIK